MIARDRKIRRIADVQARLHRIAEWHLMECQAKEQELEDRQRRIIEGFNDDSKMAELLAQTASRSLRAASVEQGIVASAKVGLSANVRSEGRKLKHVLRMVEAATGRAFREEQKQVLEDEIDKISRPAVGA